MTPISFPEINCLFTAPDSLTDEQVAPLPAYVGSVLSPNSSMDGVSIIVTAWQPTPEELGELLAGNPIFITVIGTALQPLMVTSNFQSATHPK